MLLLAPFGPPLVIACLTTYVCAVVRNLEKRKVLKNRSARELRLPSVFLSVFIISCVLYWLILAAMVPSTDGP